jgi:RimJ/RimL family protein N-acetyltransferase
MKLLPIDRPELFQLVAGWLALKENYQWLDFGDGRQQVTPEWLKIMTQRGNQVLRVFTADDDHTPIGVVGLSNVNPHFKTASFWVLLGDKAYSRQGYATRATSKMLSLGFVELGLQVINTWIVEHNPSTGVAYAVKFRPIGRQRRCHYIDGRAHDRLLFDILASEHEEI